MSDPDPARELEIAANGVLDACLEEYASLPSVVRQAVDTWKQASEAFARGQRARVPSDRPTVADGPQVDHTEPEPSGRGAVLPGELPGNLEALAAHIPVQHREFTVRIFHCDFTGRRSPNEALARTFPTEEKARDFYDRTQNIQNMKVRAKEAAAIDVVLGVQDKRSHAKKKSYREWEHVLCKGGPA